MDNVNLYFLSKEGETKISEHFQVKEFRCNDGSDVILLHPYLCDCLEVIRDEFKAPIIISSGFRTYGYNKSIGGAKYSYHLRGYAADIIVSGIDPLRVYKFCDAKWDTTKGVGQYPGFTHFDIRLDKSRWKG